MQDLKQFTSYVFFLGKSLEESKQEEDVGYWKQEIEYMKKAKDSFKMMVKSPRMVIIPQSKPVYLVACINYLVLHNKSTQNTVA